MKRISKRTVFITAVSLICLVCLVLGNYLFVYDRNKDLIYHPQMDYRVLQNQLRQLSLPVENTAGEKLLSRGGFAGIIAYDCTVSTAEEIKAYFAENFWNPHDGTHMTFPKDALTPNDPSDYEIFVHEARYTPIVTAWGHGWMHYRGNLYESLNGKDAAKDQPNFRNYYKFTIRKNDVMYSIVVYCNTDQAEIALTEAVYYLNTYQYS